MACRPGAVAPSGPAAPKALAAAATDPGVIAVDPLVGLDAQSIEVAPQHTLHDVGGGRYFSGAGGTQVTHFRPIQPKEIIPLVSADSRGALITGLTSELAPLQCDRHSWPPLLRSRLLAPGCRRVGQRAERPYNDTVFPSKLQAVTTEWTPAGEQARKLVLVTGQYSGDQSSVDATGLGTEALFTNVDALVYQGQAGTESLPPVFSRVGATQVGDGGSNGPVKGAAFSIDLSDRGGTVERVLVGYKDGNDPDWKFVDLARLVTPLPNGTTRWTGFGSSPTLSSATSSRQSILTATSR